MGNHDSNFHWYDRDGNPQHEVLSKAGTPRNATLADARKLDLVPSVTTVLSLLAKPQLEQWKIKQGILAALTLGRNEGESDDAFLSRLFEDSGEQARKAAEEGTRIHDACESSFKGKDVLAAYVPHVRGVRAKLAEMFPDIDDWVAEQSFASSLGFGGKVDLHSPSTGIVVDFKGKDLVPAYTPKLAYDQHYQLAAYQAGLGYEFAPCANIFVSRTHPGHVVGHLWSVQEIEHGWSVFWHTLHTWIAVKNYNPKFESAVAA